MAYNDLEVTVGLNVQASTDEISRELKGIGRTLSDEQALKITCHIDNDSISALQGELSKISKSLKVEAPKINVGVESDTSKLNKGTIATVYAEGAKQSDVLHRKQELLRQDFEILAAKIKKAGSSISELGNRNQPYEQIFSSLMSKNIVDFETYNRARDALAAIRKEFQLLNAKAVSDLPESAIENFRTNVEKLDNKIKLLSSDYSQLGNVSDELRDKFEKLTSLKETFDLPSSDIIIDPSDFDAKVEAYSQIKRLVDSITAELRVATKEEKEFSDVAGEIASKLNALNSQSRNRTFFNNSNNPEVSAQIKEINELKSKYQELSAQLSEAKTPEAVVAVEKELRKLDDKFKDTIESSKELQYTLRDDKALAARNNKINQLAADMNKYAEANKRAITSAKEMSSGGSFASNWASLIERMKNGAEMTDIEIQQLASDFRVFGKEAQAAGLAGAGAFEKFGNAFKLISTYISANQLINMAMSRIREATEELRNVDNILTEISKTSERTEESLRRLGESSFDAANKYGRTASDYLLGVQEMSRAGFGEQQSEDLAELSILAQAAGDMTAEMANQYLIATNAAYDLKGSAEELNSVLDSQNYITNRNALNMENLSQATKVAASQAAASGVAIDELTAAVGTMVATTQQGGDTAGRAFKGILMNIQQVKASADEIGDGGEDITTESLSKYEAAAAALGVSLKEVRNGVVQLRDPMEVLRDLSIAVGKESEGSLKVANLVAAVGGKFRGNQLIALLNNWDTYEKMLSEFNSNQAIGSALVEAEKSANNWAGSLNKVKNSWDELVSKFVESDNAVEILQSVDKIIQNLSDDSATSGLKSIADALTAIVKIISDLTDKFGTLPVLITGVTTALSFKSGKGKLSEYAYLRAVAICA